MDQPTVEPKPGADRLTRTLRWVVGSVVGIVVLGGGVIAAAYFTTPAALRRPANGHFHFRLQVVVDAKPVNFADDKYQTEFNADICTAALTKQPVHFHDKLDQFVHIHWANISGGIVLKNYGWNLIGGATKTLGYRFDQLPKIVRVPIHGQNLPTPEVGDHYYIYTGDDTAYQQRDWQQFLHADVRDFFAGKQVQASLLQDIIPAAYAHGADEEALTKLNDVVGSVVIFAQKDAPTDAQIKDRFNHLIALPQSSCGG
jgi:hypothetical protein